jgi:hypothetical protein
LAAESVGETLANAEVRAVFESGGSRGIEDADLDTVLVVGLRLECATARVANFADEDGRLAKVELVALDLEIVLVVGYVLVDAEFGLWRALVLDLDFEMEWRHTLESDGNDLFTLSFSRTVTVGLARLIKASAWAWVNTLLHGDRREVLP